MGESLYGPRFDNPKGFYEDQNTNRIDDDFLSCIARQWNSLLLPDSVEPEVISAYQKKLKENIFSRFEDVPLWGLKDPRISRLWPYWLPVFAEAGIQPLFILANRHPYSVASSLLKRDGMPEAQALALWVVHQLDAMDALLQHGGLVVDYDLMMDRPRHELQRIASFLGVEAQLDPDEVARFESEFLANDLRHSRYPAQTATSTVSTLQALSLEIYGELLKLAQVPGGLTPGSIEYARALVVGFRSELARSMDWMRAIDALQAALVLPRGVATSSLHLASDLESIVSLLKNTLACRDQTMVQQSMQFKKMHGELLRAEAQLDLLKDLMLDSCQVPDVYKPASQEMPAVSPAILLSSGRVISG